MPQWPMHCRRGWCSCQRNWGQDHLTQQPCGGLRKNRCIHTSHQLERMASYVLLRADTLRNQRCDRANKLGNIILIVVSIWGGKSDNQREKQTERWGEESLSRGGITQHKGCRNPFLRVHDANGLCQYWRAVVIHILMLLLQKGG